jgi:hypothetical protein
MGSKQLGSPDPRQTIDKKRLSMRRCGPDVEVAVQLREVLMPGGQLSSTLCKNARSMRVGKFSLQRPVLVKHPISVLPVL